MKQLVNWLRLNADLVSVKMTALHLVFCIGFLGLWYQGVLSKVFAGAGPFGWVIFAVAALLSIFGVVAARKLEKNGDLMDASKALKWLEFGTEALLIIGFIGTLQGAIVELTSLRLGASGGAMTAVLTSVIRGVGIAIYSTLAGSAAALWTGSANKMFENLLTDKTIKTAEEI